MQTNSLRAWRLSASCAMTLALAATTASAATCYVPGDHPTIQSAVDDASCDVISVAPGVYAENVVINRQLTLSGAGDTTIIHPSAPGPGITLSAGGSTAASRVMIEHLMVTGALGGGNTGSGISIVGSAPISYVTFDAITSTANTGSGLIINGSMTIADLVISHSSLTSNASDGFRIPTSMTSLDGLTISDSHLDNNGFAGWEAYTSTAAGPLKNVTVTNTTFNDNVTKGMYLERLSDALFDGIQVARSGTSGSFAAGIDINLKFAAFQNITIQHSTITQSGTGDPVNGVGVTIKARDDGSTYGARPATLIGATLSSNEITSNQTGIRFGEPGKNNNGPSDVAVHYNNIVGNVLLGIDNQSVPTVNATCNWWGSADGPGPVGTGHGDRVSPKVNYQPWLVAPAPDGQCIGGNVPSSSNQCKNGGWQTSVRADGSTFKNQGDCIQYVNTGR